MRYDLPTDSMLHVSRYLTYLKAKRKMGRVMQLASFSMAEVTYATGDISYLVQEQAKEASFRVKAKQENVSGVLLPAFEVDRVPGSGV
jgi:V-type H+-transporting ATPase subunit D